jgi:VanZ family protein
MLQNDAAGKRERATTAPLDRAAVLICIGLYFVIAVLSLMPGEYRPSLGDLSDKSEHFLAYFSVMSAVGILVPVSTSIARLALCTLAYAGLLEVVQDFIPSRTASFLDFAASAAGVIAGALLAVLSVRLFIRNR